MSYNLNFGFIAFIAAILKYAATQKCNSSFYYIELKMNHNCHIYHNFLMPSYNYSFFYHNLLIEKFISQFTSNKSSTLSLYVNVKSLYVKIGVKAWYWENENLLSFHFLLVLTLHNNFEKNANCVGRNRCTSHEKLITLFVPSWR